MMRTITAFAVAACVLASPAAAQEPTDARHTQGKAVFDMVCAMCHSVQPPAKAAPPMSHASAYYLRKHQDAALAAAAMVDYLREPAAERSAMPAHAIERFGLMQSQGHLSDEQLAAVATYVLLLADTAHVRGGMQGQSHSH